MRGCRHTPSKHSTALGCFLDFVLNDKAVNGESERIVCRRCGASIRHPVLYSRTSVSLLYPVVSLLLGLGLYSLLGWMKAAGWVTAPVLIVMYGAAFLLPILVERVITAAVLAFCPWRQLTCEPEYAELQWSAAAAERKTLRRKRVSITVMCIMETVTVLLNESHPVLLAAGILLIVECLTKRNWRVVLPMTAALILAGTTKFMTLPEMVELLMNAASVTALCGATLLADEERGI